MTPEPRFRGWRSSGCCMSRAKADSIAFGIPDAHRAALAFLVNLPPP